MIEMGVIDKRRKVPNWVLIYEDTIAKIKDLNDKSNLLQDNVFSGRPQKKAAAKT